LFCSQYIWDLLENGYPKPTDAEAYNALSQVEKDLLKDNKKKDSKVLFYIFQAVHENIAANSKQA
jgi:hypothetical protein